MIMLWVFFTHLSVWSVLNDSDQSYHFSSAFDIIFGVFFGVLCLFVCLFIDLRLRVLCYFLASLEASRCCSFLG